MAPLALAHSARDDAAEIQIPFARDPSGRLVHIDRVARGAACDCTCPGCGAPVIARHGDILQHHFAHAASADCAHAGESAAHLLGKQAIVDAGGLTLPAYYSRARDGLLISSFFIKPDRIDVEATVGPIRPDLLLHLGGRTLAVEILRTHTPSREKIATFRSLMLPCIEIDISRLAPEDIESSIDDVNKKWLFHPKIDADEARAAAAAAARREASR